MDAFAEQLASSGYPGISLAGVADTVGIRKPSMYHHFPNGKEEIYAAVAFRFIADHRERITTAIATENTLEDKLTALAAAVADLSAGAVSFEQRIYDTLGSVSDDTRTAVSRQYVEGVLAPVVDLFARARTDGDVAGDPEFLMNTFLHLTRATDLTTAPEGPDQIVGLFLNGARAT
ncbi:TetR/AcrR family transcriptional regulator [Rhodococcus sp. NPDC054953]